MSKVPFSSHYIIFITSLLILTLIMWLRRFLFPSIMLFLEGSHYEQPTLKEWGFMLLLLESGVSREWRVVIIQYYFIYYLNPHLRICIFFLNFRERGRETEGGKEREKNINVRDKHQPLAPCTCPNRVANTQPTYMP